MDILPFRCLWKSKYTPAWRSPRCYDSFVTVGHFTHSTVLWRVARLAGLISRYYVQKAWPQFERQHAQSRALAQKREYILPIRLDDSEVPGLPSTICFLDARRNSIKAIVDTLIEKIRGT